MSTPTLALTYDNIVSFLNAQTSGSTPTRTLTFGTDTISEANVNFQITSVQSYLAWFLGPLIWGSGDPNTIGAVNRLWLLYATAYILAALSGNLLITGFDVQVGDARLAKSQRGARYQTLVTMYMNEVKMLIMQLTQNSLTTTGGQSPAGFDSGV
jgi:hypothetical protein